MIYIEHDCNAQERQEMGDARHADCRRRLCRPFGWQWRSRQAAPHLDVAVVEAAPELPGRRTMRASAIIAAASTDARSASASGRKSSRMPSRSPSMVITDSKTSDPVRPVFLTFDGEVEEGRPFAHMVPNVVAGRRAARRLSATLASKSGIGLSAAGLNDGRTSRRRHAYPMASTLECAAARRLRRRAVEAARRWRASRPSASTMASPASSRLSSTSGRMTARPRNISCPPAPLRSLPLKNNRSSLVWTECANDADRLVAGDDLVFEEELERRFGHKLGTLKVVGGQAGLSARSDARARFRGAALRTRRRCGARHPSDFRPGPQSRLQGRRGAGRNHRRCRSPRPRYRLAHDSRALPELAALRHFPHGSDDRRAEPAVLQRHHAGPGRPRLWPRHCRPAANAQILLHPPGIGLGGEPIRSFWAGSRSDRLLVYACRCPKPLALLGDMHQSSILRASEISMIGMPSRIG